MANQMRWRYGDTMAVMAAVAPETVIEIGDLVWLDGGMTRPASEVCAADSFLHQTFAELFLGVALSRSRDGESAAVRVATVGVFGFDCLPQCWEIGDLIAVRKLPGKNSLDNQSVMGAPFHMSAIGRCVRREPEKRSAVLVAIQSTIMTGGVQVPVARRV